MCRIRYIGKISSVPYKVYLIYVVYQIYQICAKLKFEFLIIETLGFVDIIISIGVGGSKVLYLRLQINTCLPHFVLSRNKNAKEQTKTHFSWTHHPQNKCEASVLFYSMGNISVIVLSHVFIMYSERIIMFKDWFE